MNKNGKYVPSRGEDKKFNQELYDQLSLHEGKKPYAYFDTEMNSTIGIGFNLEDKDNQRIIREMGHDVQSLVSNKTSLTEDEINGLYSHSIKKAYNDADKWLPNFKEQPREVRKALTDMAFNLGSSKLNGFVNTKQAFIDGDYVKAADEMLDSKWSKQVKGRAKRLASMVRKYDKKADFSDVNALKVKNVLGSNKDKPFVDRILNADKYPDMPSPEGFNAPEGSRSTHGLSTAYTTDKNGKKTHFVFPVISFNKETGSLYLPEDPAREALDSGNFIDFDNAEDALWFTENYKEGSSLM